MVLELLYEYDRIFSEFFRVDHFLILVLSSALFCYVLYRSTLIFGSMFTSFYPLLSEKNKLETGMRVVALLNALVGAYYGNLATFNDDIIADPLHAENTVFTVSVVVSMGYFLYDLLLNGYHHKMMQKTDVLVHHIIVLITLGTFLRFRFAVRVVSSAVAVETSDVFNHIRWLLIQTQCRYNFLYVGSLLFQFISHVLWRVVGQAIAGYVAYKFGFWSELTTPTMIFTVTWFIFWYLNVVWMKKMFFTVIRVLSGKPHEKHVSTNENVAIDSSKSSAIPLGIRSDPDVDPNIFNVSVKRVMMGFKKTFSRDSQSNLVDSVPPSPVAQRRSKKAD